MLRSILLLVLCCCFCRYARSETSSTVCEVFGGNRECDDFNNNEDCGWDGGDCCPCTCQGDSCANNNPFEFCLDPESQGFPGDGYCEQAINDASCGYDGGDCCPCTCSDCSESDRLDPAALNQVYDCKEAPTALPTCVNGHINVENTAQARDLVAAMNCSGGVFTVSWKGNIVLDETIWVVDGTVLNVTGKGWNAEIDGNGVTRLFTVSNAVLHISNMKISNGNATGGGAIGASGSRLTFCNTSFTGNTASRDGGAILATEGTSILFDGETVFVENTASSGGALYITDSSSASWEGNTSFIGNDVGALIASDRSMVSWAAEVMFSRQKGDAALVLQKDSTALLTNRAIFSGNTNGALIAMDSSSVSWTEETTFFNRIASKGGALSVEGNSDFSWDSTTLFSRNTASEEGGAIYVDGSSNVTWTADTTFDNNIASNGGAIYVDGSSSVTWTANTTFDNNNASNGGALSVTGGSDVWLNAATFFSRNTASEEGGAIYIDGNSSVTWTAETVFDNNTESKGGALSVTGGSDVSWNAVTFFSRNEASEEGGVIYVDRSSNVAWTVDTTFDNNIASNGGALSVEGGGDVSWNAATFFSRNAASDEGGAIYVDGRSNVTWTKETDFFANNASSGGALFVQGDGRISWISGTNSSSNRAIAGGGGAIYVGNDGEVTWTGKTILSGNDAYDLGGAIVVVGGSISWDSSTSFFSNSLRLIQEGSGRGGALYIGDSSEVFWTGKLVFEKNSAGDRGGAIFIALSSSLEWSGETKFTFNFAGSFGGAVGSEDISVTTAGNVGQPSSLVISSATHFLNNTCQGSGGGTTLLWMLNFHLSTDDEVNFKGNSATTSGGGVYISGMERGPILSGTRFVSNSASAGGGLYAAGSHTKISESSFTDNYANDSGGAIDSFNGVNSLTNTEFRGNSARVGGALTLYGTASMSDCSVLENTSGMDGGPAVYNNLGSFQPFESCSFLENIFDCDADTCFSLKGEGNKNETVCYECGDCDTCDYGDPDSIPTCEPALPHTTSDGTIEKLEIDQGHWRATNVSTNILKCFNDEACNGGVTGDPGFCEGGYEGAFCQDLKGSKIVVNTSKVATLCLDTDCSVCAKNYAPGLGQTCTKCSDTTGGVILAIALTVLGAIVGAILILHLVSGETGGTRSLMDRITRNIPLHTLKIIIVTWQILTQFAEVARVTYPDMYQGFLNAIDVVNFDLSWVLSLECLIDVDFHGKMLFSITGPVVIMSILGTIYMIAARRQRGSAEALRNVWQKYLSMVLRLTFLVYSSVSSVLVQMFDCEKLDDEMIYLRADYSIQCDSDRHRALMVYSTIMILVYPVGIPVLFSNRTILMDGICRETDESVQSITDLWKPYRPTRFYYEVIECVRRLLLTGGVFIIDDDTTAQVSVIFMLAISFALLLEMMSPYESRMDVWVSRTGHAVVYGSMYFALLLKAEISNDSQVSQGVFEWVRITMQVIFVVLVVINAVVLVYSSRGK